ncbi:MAG: histidinol dehydrogenase [Bacteroidota bacterium]
MQIIKQPAKDQWNEILQRPLLDNSALFGTVQSVLEDVKANGDKAVKEYTQKFDGASLTSLSVERSVISKAASQVSDELKKAIQQAKLNIEKFHQAQIEGVERIETMAGVVCWRKQVAIEKVGIYIPGGTAPLFSTVLMLGVPAKIAGCKEIVLCTPPSKDGQIDPAILYTAELIGIDKVYSVGGVQAIGAMAYGTESIPQVYKIFGPGNQYVTAAKQMVNQEGTAIDMPAGPSEVQVIADETAHPEFIAADLLSQAEHGTDSQVILVSTNENVLNDTMAAVDRQVAELPRKEIALKALDNSKAILLNSEQEVVDLTNEYGPEHLIISTANCDELAEQITNAGSVFIGHLTPESAGDYASGTNHTLPTNGFAKAYSGVSLDSFVKYITFQKINEEGIKALGPDIEIMAEAEQLRAHRNAVTVRLKHLTETQGS